jgi:serine phosphatase RsbU (regulator of sigma subunit)/HAMP domain-containing protein
MLLGATAAVGVYRVMKSEQQARVGAYRDIVRLEVSSHLQTVYRLTRGLADRSEVAAGAPHQAKLALGVALLDNGAYLSQLALADASGRVLAAYPATGAPAPAQVESWGARLSEAGGRSQWVLDDAGLRLVCWAGPAGSSGRVLVARVEMERIASTLEQIASTPRAPVAFIRDDQGRVVLVGGSLAGIEGAELHVDEAEAPGDARVSLSSTARGRMEGYAGRVSGIPGIAWDVVVLEPSAAAMSETWSALRPAIIVYVAVLVLVVAVAAVAFSWLVRPLRALEVRARAAAQGAALDPVAVDRGDEVGRLLESFNLVTMRLNRLQESTRLLAKTEKLDEVAENVARAVIHLLGACDVAVLLFGEARPDTVRVAAYHGRSSERPAVSHAAVPELLSTRDIKVIAGGLEALLDGRHAEDADDAVTLALPLRVPGGAIGLLLVSRTRERPFSAAETELVSSFSSQAGLALEKASLFERERQARAEAETLQRAAQLLVEETDLASALAKVAACEAESLGMPWSDSWLDEMRLLGDERGAQSRRMAELAAVVERRLEGSDVAGVSSGVVLLRAGEDVAVSEWLGRESLGIVLASYAAEDGRVMGLLAVGSPDASLVVDERCMRIAETISHETALALERARLYREAQERAASLETVFRISQVVSSSLKVNVVLGRVLDVVQKILNADAVMLMRWNQDKHVLDVPMARGALDQAMIDYQCRADEDLPGAVLQTQQVMLISRFDEVGTAFSRIALRRGLHSALLVPLVARGRASGVLITLGAQPAKFSRADAELLSTFASHAALAIDTAELFGREHEVSRVLQASILPTRLPEFDGLELGAAYVPAQGVARIGGDYYDIFAAPDGKAVLVIADVCGKGVEAATKTSMIRFTVRGMVAAGAGPKRVLEVLNQTVHDSGDPSDIFTIWLGMLDIDTGLLLWADGGHPPALLWRAPEHRIERLGTTGPLVGAVSGARYDERTVSLRPKDQVLLYTDGVSEARRDGRLFGDGRIRRVLRRSKGAASVTTELLAAVQRYAGGALRDDAAILAVEYLGTASFTSADVRGNSFEHKKSRSER